MAVLWTEIRHYLSAAEFKKGWIIKVTYVILHQTDMLLTNFAISAGFIEANPIISDLLDKPVQLLVFKLIIPVIIAWLVPARLLLPALGVLLVVLGFNLRELSSLL